MTQIYTAKLMLVPALLRQIEENLFEKGYKIYSNPFSDEIFVENKNLAKMEFHRI